MRANGPKLDGARLPLADRGAEWRIIVVVVTVMAGLQAQHQQESEECQLIPGAFPREERKWMRVGVLCVCVWHIDLPRMTTKKGYGAAQMALRRSSLWPLLKHFLGKGTEGEEGGAKGKREGGGRLERNAYGGGDGWGLRGAEGRSGQAERGGGY
jgi:hypothetical protein